jgi:hypothetical protein
MEMTRFFTFILAGIIAISCSHSSDLQGNSFQRSIPEREGVLTEGILNFLEDVETTHIEMHSLMILRHGKIITEAYWHPFKAAYRQNLMTAGETLAALAIGFAVQEKLLTVDDPVISFFKEELTETPSPYLEKISIRHLLTMSTGLDMAPDAPDGENSLHLFLSAPLIDEPGKKFSYTYINAGILSAIINKVSGLCLAEYLKPRLFDPLNIRTPEWNSTPDDARMPELHIRTEDMARLGQLFLQKGWWNGRQLINKKWMKEATDTQIFQRDNLSYDEEMHDNNAQGYGFLFQRCVNNAYRAGDNRGNFIIIMPEEDAVLAITADTHRPDLLLNMVFKHIQPVMTPLKYSTKTERKEQLSSAIASLAIPYPFPASENTDTLRNMTFSFSIEPNERKINRLSFAFDEYGNALFSLESDGKNFSAAAGLDAWSFSSINNSPVAGYFSRSAKNELHLQLLFPESSQKETYNCRLSEKYIEIDYSNSREPGSIPLKGSLNR